MKRLTTGLLLTVGLINFVPVLGVFGQAALENMYGIAIASPEVSLLLQHRALLLAIVGALLIVSVFRVVLRQAAVVAAYVSMLSYVLLYFLSAIENEALSKVGYIDIVALVILTVAVLTQRQQKEKLSLPLE